MCCASVGKPILVSYSKLWKLEFPLAEVTIGIRRTSSDANRCQLSSPRTSDSGDYISNLSSWVMVTLLAEAAEAIESVHCHHYSWLNNNFLSVITNQCQMTNMSLEGHSTPTYWIPPFSIKLKNSQSCSPEKLSQTPHPSPSLLYSWLSLQFILFQTFPVQWVEFSLSEDAY